MFIFRSRRTTLVRKIWAECLHHESSGSAADQGPLAVTADIRSQLSAVLKRLREPVLEQLLEVLERRGQYLGPCCEIPNTRLGRHNVAPLVLMCKLWRWKDLTDYNELIRLPVCKHDEYGQYECCNPYHWARQANPEDCLCSSPAKNVLSPLNCDNNTDPVPYYGCDYSENGVPPPPGGAGEVWLPGYLPPPGPHTTTTTAHHPPDYNPGPGGGDVGGSTPRVREFNETEVPYNNHNSATTCDKSDACSSPVISSPRDGNDWEFLSNSPSPPPFANLKVAGSSPPHNKGYEGDCVSDANDNHGLAGGRQAPSRFNGGCIPGSLQQLRQPDPVAAARNCGQSVATGGTYDPELNGCQTWCTLAYWEERKRVGRQFPVSSSSVQVFSSLSGRLEPDCQALCLQTISARDNAKAPQSIVKARDKIGLGVVLSYSGSTVSVYNRSDIPLFVNSPTLDLPNSRNFSVYKILPGYSMKVFDFVTSKNLQTLGGAGSGNLGGGYQSADGPYDPHAVRLSFGKGWGGKYSRQIVTSCPCWLEILLVPPR